MELTMKYLGRIFKTLMITLLVSGFTTIAFAQQQPGGKNIPDRPRWPMAQNWSGARASHAMLPNLTDEQKSSIKDTMLNTRKAILPIQNQLREDQAHLHTLMTTDKIDMKAVNSQADKIGDLRTQIMKQRLASRQQIREQLTDEQKVIFDSRPQGKFHRIRDRRGR